MYSPFGPYPDEEGKVLSPKKKKQPAKKAPVAAAKSANTAAKKKAQLTLSSSTRQVSGYVNVTMLTLPHDSLIIGTT